MERDTIKIEKLQDASQWLALKFQVKIVLSASDLYEVVTGELSRPENSASDNKQKLKNWKKVDAKAQQVIGTSVGQKPLLHIINSKNSCEMRNKLHSVFEQKSDTGVHYFQQQFYSCSKDSAHDMATHISKLEKIVQQLSDLGEVIQDSMVITKILMMLPTQLNHFHSAWESTTANETGIEKKSDKMFKSHLEMIGRNETPSKKAKFWQSYVRSLKGSDDIRAHDSPRIRSWRPYSAYVDSPSFRSIYAEPNTPAERISSSGYRYLPVHRETYGYSPRPIYDHHYSRTIPAPNYDIERSWNEHLKRMSEIERRYPSRYGLYLKDTPNALVPLEYEPEDKPLFSESARARSVPPLRPFERAASYSPFERAGSVSPFERASSLSPLPSRLRASSLEPLDSLFSKFDRPLEARSHSPTPVKAGRWAPRDTEVAYDSDGLPIYHAGLRRNNFRNLMNPSPRLPITAITRDPWWWDLEDLRPFRAHLPYRSLPPFLRDSYLSPVKRTYLWYKHPIRPFAHNF